MPHASSPGLAAHSHRIPVSFRTPSHYHGSGYQFGAIVHPNNVRITADRCQIQPTGLSHENSGLRAHRPSDWTGKLCWGVSVCSANQAGHEFCLSSPISLGQNCLATPSDILVPLACTVPSITHAEPVQCQLVLKATSLGEPSAVKAKCLWYLPISGDSELNTEAN